MKKIRTLLLFVVLLLGMSVVVSADSGVKIKVDGNMLQNAEAVLKDGSTLLPVRSVSNALGGDVVWDGLTKTVHITKDNIKVVMPVGEKYMTVNDEKVEMSVPAQVINGRTYVPLRVLGNALDCGITWVKETKTVEITNNEITQNKDLFGGTTVQVIFPENLYTVCNETVFLSVDEGIARWSTNGVFNCSWEYYKGQEFLKVHANAIGSGVIEFFSSGEEGSELVKTREIIVQVVNASSPLYQKQKAERVASGLDIMAYQEPLMKRENEVIYKYGIRLDGYSGKMYMIENYVLIIPIKSNQDLTGTFYLRSKTDRIEATMDYYNGNPAIFIKCNEGHKYQTWTGTPIVDSGTPVILRYVNDTNEPLSFKHIEEDNGVPSLLTERSEFLDDPKVRDLETAVWTFDIIEDKDNYIMQEKVRQDKGISYDLYLNGQA